MRAVKGLFLMLLVAGALSFASSSQGQQNQQSAASSGEESKDKGISLWQPTDSVGFYTLVLTAFTAALAISTGFLWWETRQARRLTKDAMVIDNRAFVFATGFTPNWEFDAHGVLAWRFHPEWMNSGDTPTKNLRLYHGVISPTLSCQQTMILLPR